MPPGFKVPSGYQYAFKEVKSGGNFFVKKFPPEPPSRNSITLWLAGFLVEETGKPEHKQKLFDSPAGCGGTFFQPNVPRGPQITFLKAHWYQKANRCSTSHFGVILQYDFLCCDKDTFCGKHILFDHLLDMPVKRLRIVMIWAQMIVEKFNGLFSPLINGSDIESSIHNVPGNLNQIVDCSERHFFRPPLGRFRGGGQ